MVSMDMQKTVLPQGAEDNCKHKNNEMPEPCISLEAFFLEEVMGWKKECEGGNPLKI